MIQSDYDLAKPLATALKAKAPYVGIPMPGHAPLIFRRELLVGSLKGVRVVNVEVQPSLIGEDGCRYLVVDGTAEERWSGRVLVGRVRHYMKVRSLHRSALKAYGSEHAKVWKSWLEKERKARITPKSPAPKGKYEKVLAKLKKELDRLGGRPQIFNPAVATQGRVLDDWRAGWLRWKEQQELRGKVGALAKTVQTSRKLYAGLRALGLAGVRTFSDLDTGERRSLVGSRYSHEEGTYLDYAKPENLWRFQPGLVRQRPNLYGDDYADPERWGAGRYASVLEWIRERKELVSQIEGAKVMMEDAQGGKAGNQ